MSKHTVAIFVSGRLTCYEKCLVPLIENIKHRYNVKLFCSFNETSFDPKTKTETLNAFIRQFHDVLGFINMVNYKMPYEYVQLRIKANIDNFQNYFQYNTLSGFYNDKKNLEMIEAYELANNMKFDIICKVRSDIFFYTDVNFIKDDDSELILRNKHFLDLRFWGHMYNDIPVMISDAFAYGNKYVMKKYCETYDWILENVKKFNGKYCNAGEIYMTDCILQYPMYKDVPGGGQIPLIGADEIIDKYKNNPNGIKVVQIDDIGWNLSGEERLITNFVVNRDNVFQYTLPENKIG